MLSTYKRKKLDLCVLLLKYMRHFELHRLLKACDCFKQKNLKIFLLAFASQKQTRGHSNIVMVHSICSQMREIPVGTFNWNAT